MNYKEVFNKWIDIRMNYQLEAIDKIATDLDIDMYKWHYSYFLKRTTGFTGFDALDEILSEFLFYLDNEFKKVLLTYIPADGKNIYGEPYLLLDFNLVYDNDGINVKKNEAKNFKKLVRTLTFSQREELMKNKLFSYIVIKTNLKIYSNNDIRILKLRNLNEYQNSIKR